MVTKKTRIPRILWYVFCVLYVCVMLWLLFFMRLDSAVAEFGRMTDYGQALSRHFNPLPGQVIAASLRKIRAASSLFDAGVFGDFRNLVGNVVLFVPLGWILPYFLPFARKTKGFLLSDAALILLVEFTQAFTLSGYCDFDDLLLNVLGGWIGFLILSVFRKKRNRKDLTVL